MSVTLKSMLLSLAKNLKCYSKNYYNLCRDPSHSPRGTLYPQKVGSNFSDKWRSLGTYSSDSGHVVFFHQLMGILSNG
jgi:hypothetical protein